MRNGSGPRRPQPPIGKYIEAARRSLRLTQVAMAKEIGVSTRTLHEWEADDTRPTKTNLRAMCTRVEALDPAVGAKLRAAVTGVAEPVPRAPSVVGVLSVIIAAADELDVAPRRVVHVVETVLARIAAEGFTVEGARAALAERGEGGDAVDGR